MPNLWSVRNCKQATCIYFMSGYEPSSGFFFFFSSRVAKYLVSVFPSFQFGSSIRCSKHTFILSCHFMSLFQVKKKKKKPTGSRIFFLKRSFKNKHQCPSFPGWDFEISVFTAVVLLVQCSWLMDDAHLYCITPAATQYPKPLHVEIKYALPIVWNPTAIYVTTY